MMLSGTTGAGTQHHQALHHVHHDSEREHAHKIPFWIGLDRHVVSGIRKSTTCQDIIRSLIPSSGESPPSFVIVEKWRKMERRLEPNTRILKVWKAWGDQQDDMTLVIKHYNPNGSTESTGSITDGYIDKKSSNRSSRRRSSHRLSNHQMSGTEETVTADSVERLLKLVLTQGETIQIQLKKLRYKEEQIEKYEEKMHLLRSLQEGENYVVESYLRDGKISSTSGKRILPTCSQKRETISRKNISGLFKKEKSNESDEVQIQTLPPKKIESEDKKPNERPEYLREQKDLLEKICELNKKLTKEEERLVKVGLKLKTIIEISSESLVNSPMSIPTQETELYQLLIELNTLREITNGQTTEIERNEQSLTDLENILDSKHDYLTQLTYEIQLVDLESEVLQQRLRAVTPGLRISQSKTQDLMVSNEFLSQPMRNEEEIRHGLMSLVQTTSSNQQHPSSCQGSDGNDEKLNSSNSTHSSRLNLNLKTIGEDNDSNSDTGISSLHSSGDEHSSIFLLDTLV